MPGQGVIPEGSWVCFRRQVLWGRLKPRSLVSLGMTFFIGMDIVLGMDIHLSDSISAYSSIALADYCFQWGSESSRYTRASVSGHFMKPGCGRTRKKYKPEMERLRPDS